MFNQLFSDKQWPIKIVSVVVILMFTVAALVVYTSDLLNGKVVPDIINNVVFLILGFATQQLGFTHGITTANGVASDTATAVVKEMQK